MADVNNIYPYRGAPAKFSRKKRRDSAGRDVSIITAFRYDAILTRADPAQGESPLEVYGHYARFVFHVVQGGHDYTCNVDPVLIGVLKQNTSWAAGMSSLHSMLVSNGAAGGIATAQVGSRDRAAFRTKMSMGNYRGRTPGEILESNPAEEAGLRKQRDFLASRLTGTYAGSNQKQLDAIDDALSMLDELKASMPEEHQVDGLFAALSNPAPFQILKIPMLPNRYKPRASDQKCPVHALTVEWNFGQDYPVHICISEWYADIIKKEDGTIRALNPVDRKTAGINLAAQDWLVQVSGMERNLRMFENINPGWYFHQAEKLSLDARKAYQERQKSLASTSNGQQNYSQYQNNTQINPGAYSQGAAYYPQEGGYRQKGYTASASGNNGASYNLGTQEQAWQGDAGYDQNGSYNGTLPNWLNE